MKIHLSGEDLATMLERIPAETFAKEFREYIRTVADVEEVRIVIRNFLDYYVRAKR